MGYFNMTYYDSLMHSGTKRDLNGTSVSKEKGTDNKANNTSAYNHDYYMRHKDKWGVKTETGTQKDWDEFDKLSEENRIGDSDFFAKKNADGTWTIYEEDMVWRLPKGVELDADMKKALSEFKGMQDPNIKNHKEWEAAVEKIINAKNSGSGEKEFDVDAAAMDVIRGKYKNGAERKAALGDDYEMVQKRVNEMYKSGKFGGGTSTAASAPAASGDTAAASGDSGSSERSTKWYKSYNNKIADSKAAKAEKELQERAAKEAQEQAAQEAAKKKKKK